VSLLAVGTPWEIGEPWSRWGLGGCRGHRRDVGGDTEEIPRAREVRSTRRAPQAVVAHLGAAAWQDVLYEPPEKLDAGERDAPERLRPVVTITKRHVRISHLLEPTVADRNAGRGS
jgi:hypothetical protein